MKVIFVIQGEGRGHLTQALALQQILLHEGHEVVKVLVGKSKNRVIPAFFLNQIGAPVDFFNTPNFLPSKDNRKFNLLRSLAFNSLLLPGYFSSIHFIRKNIQESGADIVINFYEILCGITCSLFRLGVPEVCIGHQYLFLHPSFQMPGKYLLSESLLKFFTRVTSLGATSRLALSIRDYPEDPVHGIRVVPPLLRREAKTIIRHHGNYIMGYILNAGFAEDVMAWHEKHPHIQLHFFWDKPGAPEEQKIDDTLTFHRINDVKFLKLLAGCKAYATTAGFESVCEALYMGKPCMMIPAHVEQECNALDAERELAGVKSGKKVYCTDDDTVKPVGSTGEAGLMSPRNLWVTTIGDEMKIASNGQAKVIGVSLKDRASILPAGHNPNGAFWFDDESGKFITSSYYMNQLPKWIDAFNNQHLPERYLAEKWNTLYPKNTYIESTADENEYEDGIRKGVKATLPLNLPALYKKYGYGIIRKTPFGNALTMDLAKAAVEGEQLGADDETDLLAVSCSSTDYIGHQVGTHAIETEDTYLRLDKAIADFLSYLDGKVGKGNYLIFLTADHGAMNNARFLQDRRIPAGSWDGDEMAKKLNQTLAQEYPNVGDLVKAVMNYQVFFNRNIIKENKLDFAKIKQSVVDILKEDSCVQYACDMEKTMMESIPEAIKFRIVNGFNRERSGDVAIVLKPDFYAHGMKGTDHGEWNPYDTHIPLVFMGWGIQHGATNKETFMTDIVPTISALLHIQVPNGCIGQSIF